MKMERDFSFVHDLLAAAGRLKEPTQQHDDQRDDNTDEQERELKWHVDKIQTASASAFFPVYPKRHDDVRVNEPRSGDRV